MHLSRFEETVNGWGDQRIPFLFMVDFEMNSPAAFMLDQVPDSVLFDVNGISNFQGGKNISVAPGMIRKPISREAYRRKFSDVYCHLERGDSYLTNLTIKSEISLESSLQDLFISSHARYKLLVNDLFLVFSPETFVRIRDNRIYSYPMKGTINAALPDAAEIILNDRKELAEHVTIVDLIRNDLSQIAVDVQVTRFRYLEEIHTNHGHLFQVSSEIRGELESSWTKNIGSLLLRLLPAGSVSGAPKPRTLEIIRHAEGEDRGFYTGVFGIFDGNTLDSGVMIRFIEKQNGKLFYRSGGGITTQSMWEAEYQEAIDKIYVPVN